MHYNDVSTRKALYVMCISYDNELKHQLKHCQQTKYGPITELQICGLEYISGISIVAQQENKIKIGCYICTP